MLVCEPLSPTSGEPPAMVTSMLSFLGDGMGGSELRELVYTSRI